MTGFLANRQADANAVDLQALISQQQTSQPPVKISTEVQHKADTVDTISDYQALQKQAANDLRHIQSGISQLTKLANQAANNGATPLLALQFQNAYDQLKYYASDSFEGKALFDGKFSMDASGTLGKYLFTGASNQPTKDQAKLSLPDILSQLSSLSISNPSNTEYTLQALQATAKTLPDIAFKINDFGLALTYAENNLKGVGNTGPSITQIDTLARAKQASGAAAKGVSNIAGSLQQLLQLAQKATTDNLTDTDRAVLNQQFSSALSDIEKTAGNTTDVEGRPLLNGNFHDNITSVLASYLTTGSGNSLTQLQADVSLGNFGISGLFNPKSLPRIDTQDGAKNAITAIVAAIGKASKTVHDMDQFSDALNVAENNMKKANGGTSPISGFLNSFLN